MSARHISELRRERVKDPDLALLAALSQAAGETFRLGRGRSRVVVRSNHTCQQWALQYSRPISTGQWHELGKLQAVHRMRLYARELQACMLLS